MIKERITKFTVVGIGCTLFSMISFPVVLKYLIQNDSVAYFVATILNISVSYLSQSIISFNLSPSLNRFIRYINVSIGIIILGNISYFIFLWISESGLIAYYSSWIITSLISFLVHYKFTFRK